jgi:aflatoxin B1 aldehyde reductase
VSIQADKSRPGRQSLYNALHRAVEPELFPALRKYGLAFYAYNPLGGGIFTGRYRSIDATSEDGARFDPNTAQGKTYRQRYWNEGYFAAIETVEAAAKEAGLSMTETALRWISHHSLMKREHGDAVIIGASSVKHLEENLADLEKGPLPQDVVDAVNAAWRTVAADNNKYWH